MQTKTNSHNKDILDPNQFIVNKLQMISKLQENKIGDYEKLEKIKKSLITDGSLNLKDSKYIETQYEEYKKAGMKES